MAHAIPEGLRVETTMPTALGEEQGKGCISQEATVRNHLTATASGAAAATCTLERLSVQAVVINWPEAVFLPLPWHILPLKQQGVKICHERTTYIFKAIKMGCLHFS